MSLSAVGLSVLALSAGVFVSNVAPVSVIAPTPKCEQLGPKKLPAVNTLLDSAALMARLSDMHGSDDIVDTVSVHFSGMPGGRITGATAPTAMQNDIVAAVMQNLRASSNSTPEYVRVRARHGASPAIALERSVLCGPVTSMGAISTEVRVQTVVVSSNGAMPSAPPVSAGMGTPIRTRLRVSEMGFVTQVDFSSGSSNSQVENAIRDRMLAVKYTPATLDGVPIAVWVEGKNVEIAK